MEMEMLAAKLGVACITRKKPGGAKAGNINNAIAETKSPLIAVFDADHVPHRDFLKKTAGYFSDSRMGFVQSPQYYRNYGMNEVTSGAWEQQSLFFGAICKGRNRLNSTTMCGTNMVIRRQALSEVGNICTESIAEDFVTGMLIHQRGWRSCYVPEVLAEGLAPEDFLSYYKQQFRWARGSLDVLFRYNFMFKRGLSLSQRVQYLSAISYFLSGIVVLIDALIPAAFFFTGLVPLQISTMLLAGIFLPYILTTIYVLQASTNFSYSFKSLAFSIAGFNIHLSAIFAAILGTKNGFSVTSKRKIDGNFIGLVVPQMAYFLVTYAGAAVAILRSGITTSFVSNFAWVILNTALFSEFMSAALPGEVPAESKAKTKAVAVAG
jgi:cellulose synthase (UDP-forming)